TTRASHRYGPDGRNRWDHAAGSGPSERTKAVAARAPYRTATRRRARPGHRAAAAQSSVTSPGNSWRSAIVSPFSHEPHSRTLAGAETYDRTSALNIVQSP